VHVATSLFVFRMLYWMRFLLSAVLFPSQTMHLVQK
jgi:hypothetical protein